MIRPEIVAAAKRYREALIGAGCVALAALIWWSLPGWFYALIALLVAGLGASILAVALKRQRLHSEEIGPGVVELNEREVSYFAPAGGGIVSLDALALVTARRAKEGVWAEDLIWQLEEDGGAIVAIPNSASGAEKLFDAFAALPGADLDAATRALRSAGDESFVIWSKPRPRLH